MKNFIVIMLCKFEGIKILIKRKDSSNFKCLKARKDLMVYF